MADQTNYQAKGKHEHMLELTKDQANTGTSGVRWICQECGDVIHTYDPELHKELQAKHNGDEQL